ncbi:MAG: hypothetical protein D6737_18810 [Chloroflexi bacterium]|nr:MAG: hypothetical protein D6737_18810 [Chloroflexota bacterium]
MMQRMRLFLLSMVLSTVLTAPALVTYAQDVDDTASCAATPDQILGQGYGGFSGAAGETSETGITPEGEDIVGLGLVADINYIANNLVYSGSGNTPVAILVVDDFSLPPDPDMPVPQVSHGFLVMEVLEHLQSALPAETQAIQLVPVDISDIVEGYTSDFIIRQLTSTMNELSAQGVERFVVNMSFVFVPCRDPETGFDFRRMVQTRRTDPMHSIIAELGNNRDYVTSLLIDNRVEAIDATGLTVREGQPERDNQGNRGQSPQAAQIQAQIVQEEQSGRGPQFRQQELRINQLFDNMKVQSDPLRAFFRSNRGIVVPVASSGNFKARTPFFPARWAEVLAVSASEGDDLGKWLHSNNGEVMVPGAWYLFDDGVYRAGTSFAAPVVSMMTAIDLTQSRPLCGVRGNAPALAQGGNFDNTLLLDAVQRSC